MNEKIDTIETNRISVKILNENLKFENAVRKKKPRVVGCYISIYGFSRVWQS